MQGNQQDMDVLRGWCAFVEATGLAKSRVKETDVYQEQHVRLSADNVEEDSKGFRFSLSAEQTRVLAERYVKESEEGTTQSEALQLGFPLLRVIEGKQAFFVPLFRYSLPDDWHAQPEFSLCVPVKQGIEVVPDIDAFRAYLDIDIQELGAERHMMSLAAACTGKQGETFVAVFRTFLAWINHRLAGLKTIRNDVADVHLEKAITGLICPPVISDFNSREQLKDYKVLLERPDLKTSPLLQRYILQRSLGNPASRHQYSRFPYGLFERKYPLGRGQMQTLTQVASGVPLVAVQGAPGTGKTTLFKSLIASRIVERALACIAGEDRNLGVVVTSTAKKAVENVIDDLRDDPCLNDFKWFYFLCGDKAQVTSEIDRVHALLRKLDEQSYDKEKQEALADRVVAIKQTIDGVHVKFLRLLAAFEDARSAFSALSPESFRERLDALIRDVRESSEALGMIDHQEPSLDYRVLTSHCNGALEALAVDKVRYTQAKDHLSRSYAKLIDAPFEEMAYQPWLESKLSETLHYHFSDYPRGFMASLRAWMSRRKYARARDHLKKNCPDDMTAYGLDSLDHAHLAELARNRGDVFSAGNAEQVFQTLRQGPPEPAREASLKLLVKAIAEVIQRSSDWHRYEAARDSFNAEFPEGDWIEVLRLRFIAQQRSLFEHAIDYLWQELLRQKDVLGQALSLWCNMLDGQTDSGFYKWKDKLQEFYRLISLAYPVMASTLASVQKLPGYKLADLNGFTPYALSLVDEAGMVSAESLVPLLARSERSIVVGDPLQIEPIRTLGSAMAGKLKDQHFADNTLYEAVSPMLVTAYHRAAGTFSGAVDDMGDGIVLDEHRRCRPAIAELFMQIAGYHGVQVCTQPAEPRIQAACDKMGGFNLMFYGVEGRKGPLPNTNQDEVEAIGLLLDKLEGAGYDLARDVGIITPYSNQKNLLIKTYGERLGQRKALKIGSVHQFQGVGFEVIIYSPVIFQRTDRDQFQNGKPNLLNVAVSRAKQQFIVVGNQHRLLNAGKSLEKMARACSASFFVSMEHQSPSFTGVAPGGIRHYFDCEHIQAFESLITSSQRSFVAVVPWIRQGISPNHPPLKLLQAAQQRGVDVKVYYGHDHIEHPNADDGEIGLIKAYRNKLGAENVIRLPEGTHEKILMVDDQLAMVGSWNWLSHSYYRYCEISTGTPLALRRETSVELRDPALINQLKSRIASRNEGPSPIR
ncbi:AAA domain-containing protein [Pseudomonas kribbensis]|uniref:AAA domain-containing protein n=1 Tax=Pseudomonas kribbensis TaxID=1628086 RepID=UPI003D786BBC